MYFVIFKWNIELLQILIFELVQYTFYQYFYTRMQIQGYIVRLFSIEINRKYLLLYNNTNYFTIDDEANNNSDLYLIGFWISAVKWEYEYLTCNWSLEQLFFSLNRLLKLDELLQCRLPVPDLPISSIG